MESILTLLNQLPRIPIEYMLAVIAILALGLAAFVVHVVHSLLQRGNNP